MYCWHIEIKSDDSWFWQEDLRKEIETWQPHYDFHCHKEIIIPSCPPLHQHHPGWSCWKTQGSSQEFGDAISWEFDQRRCTVCSRAPLPSPFFVILILILRIYSCSEQSMQVWLYSTHCKVCSSGPSARPLLLSYSSSFLRIYICSELGLTVRFLVSIIMTTIFKCVCIAPLNPTPMNHMLGQW